MKKVGVARVSDVFKEKRLGRFLIDLDVLGSMDEIQFTQVFGKFRILRADFVPGKNTIDYLAGSRLFDVLEDENIPYYQVNIESSSPGRFKVTVEKNVSATVD